jgi:hypothetical protein
MSLSSSTRRSSPRRSARIPKLTEKALSKLQQEAFVVITGLEADAAKVKGDVIGMVGTGDSPTIGTTDSPPNTDDSAVATEVQMSLNAHSPAPADQDSKVSAVATPKKATKKQKGTVNAKSTKAQKATILSAMASFKKRKVGHKKGNTRVPPKKKKVDKDDEDDEDYVDDDDDDNDDDDGEGLLIGIEHFDHDPDWGASFVGHVPCLEMQAAFSFMVSVHDCSIIIHSIMCNVFDTRFSVIECT